MYNRKLAKQSPIRPSFLAYSDRFERVSALESEIELDYFNLLNFEGTASLVRTQPFSIHYRVGNRTRRYTPDFLVVEREIECAVEIKPYRKTQAEDFKLFKSRVERLFAQRGQVFQVITERDVRIGARAKNLRHLQAALGHPAPYEEIAQLKRDVPFSNASLCELQAQLPSLGLDPSLVRRGIAHKLLRCDLTLPWHRLHLTW